MRRPRGPGLQRLAGRMPGVVARIDPAEAAYEEAARQAFRDVTTLEAPRPIAPAPAAEDPALSGTAPSVTSVSASPAPTAESPELSGTARPVTSVSASPAPTAESPTPKSAPEPAAAEQIEQWHRKQASDTAPDFLLRTPARVTLVADDFFDGLIRRVEGDR